MNKENKIALIISIRHRLNALERDIIADIEAVSDLGDE